MSKNLAYDFPELFKDFAMMPRFNEDIEALSQMAEPEDWDYRHAQSNHPHPVLRSYITYTYRRIAEEKKIAITADEEFCCWNAGLITASLEAIYVIFSRNKLPGVDSYWHFWKFARRGEWELNRFPTLPDMAHYFEDPSVLVLDVRKELRINVNHVVAENLDRFPVALQVMNQYGLQNLVWEQKTQLYRESEETIRPRFHNTTLAPCSYFCR